MLTVFGVRFWNNWKVSGPVKLFVGVTGSV